MSANTSASSIFFSTFLIVGSVTASFGQEFDWGDATLQGRLVQPGQSETYADRGLPGVRKNPFSDRQKGTDCVEASVSGRATGQIGSSSNCDDGGFVIFSVRTERVNGESSK